MQVSAKTDYALRAASELALAATEDAGPIKGDWISETQGIPKKFMENILHDLKRSGIVRTRRGASGGYWLALPAEEISLAAIIRAVEGPSPTSGASGPRLSSTRARPNTCRRSGSRSAPICAPSSSP